MYSQVFAVIAPILICSLIGVIWAKLGLAFESEFVARLVMMIGAPCLIVSTLSEVNIERGQLFLLAGVGVCGMLGTAAFAFVVAKLLRADMRSTLPPLTFPNCGNMGLPLCLFAFGEPGLAAGLIIFMVTAVSHFAFGVAIVSGRGVLGSLLQSPVFYAAIISCLLILTGWSLPLWLDNTVGLLGKMSIPLMLISLGVSLVNLQVHSLMQSSLYAVLRLGGGLMIGLALVEFFDLQGIQRGVVLIQFAMPSAVFNYLLAQRYNRQPDLVAGVVVTSTIMSFLTLPLLLWFVYQY